jgi:hypothetical protein
MNRFYVCAAAVALLSAISFPATAVMFRAAPTTANQAAMSPSPAPAPALSPEGKPVRVISLQGSASSPLVEAPAPGVSSSPSPAEVKVALSSEQPVAAEPPKVAPSAPKRVASMRQAARPAVARTRSLVAISSLY